MRGDFVKRIISLLIVCVLLFSCVGCDENASYDGLESEHPNCIPGNGVDTVGVIHDITKFNMNFTNLPTVGTYSDRLPLELKANRQALSEKEKHLYDRFLPFVLSYTEFSIDLKDFKDFKIEELERALRFIHYDYPETWMYISECYKDLMSVKVRDGYYENQFFSYGIECFQIYKQVFDKNNFNKNETKVYIEEINNICNNILTRMPSELNVKERYKWIADYICSITEYDYTLTTHIFADSPLKYGKGVCQAYAYLYQWLCQNAGLWCITCNGSLSGGAHAWNAIRLENGEILYMDVTNYDITGKYCFMTYNEAANSGFTFDDDQWIVSFNY